MTLLHTGPPCNVLSEIKSFPLKANIAGINETGEALQVPPPPLVSLLSRRGGGGGGRASGISLGWIKTHTY